MSGHDRPDIVLLADPGQMLAALSTGLGFHPSRSLVVMCLRRGTDPAALTVERTLRADLPEPDQYAHFVASMTRAVLLDPTELAILVVVDQEHEPHTQPHLDLVTACRDVLDRAGIQVVTVLWASSTTPGSTWVSGENPPVTGAVPDSAHIPSGAELFAAVVYDTREALASTLKPDELAVLDRRATLINDLAAHDAELPRNRAGGLAYVEAAIDRAADGILPTGDDEIARLAIVLSDHVVRDAVLTFDDAARQATAERLWRALVRATPVPHRYEPASVLAIAAYGRGDGVLAGLALDASNVDHRLTHLIRAALSLGTGPARMRQITIAATRDARWTIHEDGSVPA